MVMVTERNNIAPEVRKERVSHEPLPENITLFLMEGSGQNEVYSLKLVLWALGMVAGAVFGAIQIDLW
jgi:hypothetical protein